MHAHPAAIDPDDLPHDGQPQARASPLPRLLGLIKPIEDMGQILGRYAGSDVADGHFRRGAICTTQMGAPSLALGTTENA